MQQTNDWLKTTQPQNDLKPVYQQAITLNNVELFGTDPFSTHFYEIRVKYKTWLMD